MFEKNTAMIKKYMKSVNRVQYPQKFGLGNVRKIEVSE